jgi:hypothetical protein
MRRILFFLLSLVVTNIYAQDELPSEAFSPLKNIHRIDVVVDWSSLKIDSLTQEEWIEIRQKENPKYDARIELDKQLKPQLFSCCIPRVNTLLVKYNLKFVRFQDTPISIIIIPLHISKNGKWECEFRFQKTETKEVFAQFNLDGRASAMGSLQTKWETIFINVGDHLGQYLKKQLKEIYK